MANRTIQFLGLAYGSTPATLTATADGSTVFSGSLTTLDQPVPALPDPLLIDATGTLFGLEVDTAFIGNVVVTCQVTNGTVIFAQTRCNYTGVTNPIYSPEQRATLSLNTDDYRAEKIAIYKSVEAVPPLSAEDIAIIDNPDTPWPQIAAIRKAHKLGVSLNGGANAWQTIYPDPFLAVTIDGVPQTLDLLTYPDAVGHWWYTVSSGSTLSLTLQVPEILPAL